MLDEIDVEIVNKTIDNDNEEMLIRIQHPTIGSDPELFCLKDGIPIPVFKLKLGGTKQKPIEFEPGFAYQEDGCAAEYNIPPCRTVSQFISAHYKCINKIQKVLGPHVELINTPSISFHPSLLKSKKATIIGCSEDFDVYLKDKASIPDYKGINKRFAGFHVHVGWKNPTWFDSELLIRYMDLYLGVPASIIDHDKHRMEAYGTAGRFRPKVYGLEYRSLSNFWLETASHIEFVWNQTQKAIGALNKYYDLILDANIETRVISAMNNGDELAANLLIKEFDVCEPPAVLK